MNPPALEALFETYRVRRDPAALGQVFDRTAGELLRVARHLLHDRQAAEDVLQETFLAAIQDAGSFDGSRPLKPWLLGILVRRAALWRRRQGRAPVVETVESGAATEDPVATAALGEVRALVSDALSALPQRYREVVSAYLEERRGVDVARALRRNPATVRTQLARGLAWLRGLLPQGVLGGWIFLLTSRRSLAAVKARVLGSTFPELSAAGSISSWSVLGGLAVNKVALVVASGVVLFLAAQLFLHGDGDPGAPAGIAAVPPSAAEVPEPAAEEPVTPRRAAEAPVPLAPPQPVSAVPASYRAALAGLTGRLLEADHRPRGGATLTLLELRIGDLVAHMGEQPGPVAARFDPCVGIAVTDADGRFLFTGLEPAGLHALGIDLGTSRATLRIVDLTLDSGSVTDLGDVVLDPLCVLRGKVTDAQGQPVAAALVRAGCFPLPFLAGFLAQIRPDAQLLVEERGRTLVLRPPEAVAGLLDRLPVPAARTGNDGIFEISGAPTGFVTLIVQHDQLGAATVGPFPSGKNERKVPDIVLRPGRSWSGTVVDATGRPVPEAEVCLGSFGYEGFVVLHPCGPTDSGGAFSGLLDVAAARVWVAARASAGDAWTVRSGPVEEPLEIELPAVASLRVTLRGPDGELPSAAYFRLLARTVGDVANLAERIGSEWNTTVEGDGSHVLAPVTQGEYVLIARAAGFVALAQDIGVREDPTHVELELTRGVEQVLRLVDDATSEPVEHARVTVSTGAEVGSFRSDAGGRVVLPDVPPAGTVRLLLEHPSFATQEQRVPAGGGEREIRMLHGGTLEGTALFEEPVMVVVLSPMSDAPPFLTIPDAGGRFRLERLPAGRAVVLAYPRCLTGDPLSGMLRLVDSLRAPLAEKRVTLEERAVTVVELADPDILPPARITGVVRRNGVPLAGHEVVLSSREIAPALSADMLSTLTDARGEFLLDSVPPGGHHLTVRLDALDHRQPVELEAAAEVRVEIDLEAHPVLLEILRGPSRLPVAEQEVRISGSLDGGAPEWESLRTDSHGRTELELPARGTYFLTVYCPSVSPVPERCQVTAPAAEPIVVHFQAVECEGSLQLPQGVLPEGEGIVSVVLLNTSGSGGLYQQPLELTGAVMPFRFTVPPGRYQVTVQGRGYRSRPLDVEVPPEGCRGFFWEFELE